MSTACTTPLGLAELIDYQLGELDDLEQARIEEHYFACDVCSRRLESVQQLGVAIVDAVREGRVSASVTAALIARGEAAGLRVRSYRVAPGEQVACTAAPDDDFVAIRLALDAERSAPIDVAVAWTALDSGDTEDRLISDVTLDPEAGEILLLFAGDQVRQFPRSQWRMEAVVRASTGEQRVGPYVLEHTPWEQRGER